MNNKIISAGSIALILSQSLSAREGKETNHPNILIITCHDLGQHLGCYGRETVNSPNLDRLALKGVRFSNYYSTTPLSSPARGSLFTGRYPQSNGLMGLIHEPFNWTLNPDEKLLPQILKEYGYETLLIGYTHLSRDIYRLGFDKRLSERCLMDETISESVKFVSDRKKTDKPFFVKLGLKEVHYPYDHGVDSTRGIYIPGYLVGNPVTREEFARFQGDIQVMDKALGQVFDALEKNKQIADNTLIIFTSDHGIGFAGAKWSPRKAGIEVPLIIYRPNSVFTNGKVITQLTSNVDVVPSLLEYLGIPVPANIQGRSFYPVVSGKTTEGQRKYAFAQYTPDLRRDNTSRTVIGDRYQLIWYFESGRRPVYPIDINPIKYNNHTEREAIRGTRNAYELYDLQNDPLEFNDIAQLPENKKIVEEMANALLDWMKKVDDPLLKGPTVTPAYTESVKILNTFGDDRK